MTGAGKGAVPQANAPLHHACIEPTTPSSLKRNAVRGLRGGKTASTGVIEVDSVLTTSSQSEEADATSRLRSRSVYDDATLEELECKRDAAEYALLWRRMDQRCTAEPAADVAAKAFELRRHMYAQFAAARFCELLKADPQAQAVWKYIDLENHPTKNFR